MRLSTAFSPEESTRVRTHRQSGLVEEVDVRLRARYGTESLGNLPDPLDELVFIQLTIRTREGVYTSTFQDLRSAVNGDWARLLDMDEERVAEVLQPGGMARIKLDRLRKQIRTIRDRFGETSLDSLRGMSDEEVEGFLLELPGVGPKTARCIMLYSLGRSVFPVDSHCLRIMKRLALVAEEVDRKKAHDVAQDLVPTELRYSLHVNMVHHGRNLCRPMSPLCDSCPLLDLCPDGQERVAASS